MSENEPQILEPVWEDNYTAIAMSSSEEYIPYLSVCLQSLAEHTSPNHNYDIIVFSSAEDNYQKELLINHISRDNISLRFFNPKHYFDEIQLRVTHSYFHEACFYRIVAPAVLKNYKKIIFTDIDLVFQNDIKDLYNIDLNGYAMAACEEPIWETYIDTNRILEGIEIIGYSKNVLKLKNIKKYYNTGVALFNIEEFSKNNYVELLLDAINKTFFIYQEQCALNYLLNDKTLSLDSHWNGEVHPDILYEYNDSFKYNIVHYLGRVKPWQNSTIRLSPIWWKYARKSPFYEIILQKLFTNSTKKIVRKRCTDLSDNLRAEVKQALKYRRNILQYWRSKLLSRITFGKAKNHYELKRKSLKEKIKIGKSYRD